MHAAPIIDKTAPFYSTQEGWNSAVIRDNNKLLPMTQALSLKFTFPLSLRVFKLNNFTWKRSQQHLHYWGHSFPLLLNWNDGTAFLPFPIPSSPRRAWTDPWTLVHPRLNPGPPMAPSPSILSPTPATSLHRGERRERLAPHGAVPLALCSGSRSSYSREQRKSSPRHH